MENKTIIKNVEAVINRALKAGLLNLEEAVEMANTLKDLKERLK